MSVTKLGGEPQPFVGIASHIQRLDAERIACCEDLLAIAQHEGEHAVELCHARRAHILVKMENDLGIGVCAEVVSILQLAAQPLMVVYLAVANERQITGFVV